MNKSSIIAVVIVVVLAIAGVWLFSGDSQTEQPTPDQNDQATTTQSTSTPPPATTQDETSTDNTTSSPSQQSTEANTTDTEEGSSQVTTVTYTQDGFSPETVEIESGDTVRFVNESNTDMWVASDQHPTHTQYAGTSLREHCSESSNQAFDQCEGGDTYSFTFNKTGSWSYHNHLQARDGGTVMVE